MVYIPPPQFASATRPSYSEAYTGILTTHRRSPLTSASSVTLLVAQDVDALCAARMLADLFKQDDVMYRIIPISGLAELERTRDDLVSCAELHSLVLVNMGNILDLRSEEWFGEFPAGLTVHVIDSSRPINLSSLFGAGEVGERIIIWDDGTAENLVEEKKAWEAIAYDPEPDSDSDSEESDIYESPEEVDEAEEHDTEEGTTKKRKSLSNGERAESKRRRLDGERPDRMTREQRDEYHDQLDKYYSGGTWYGQSASATIYILATALERVDNELLWLAILGLTHQYTTSRISREYYERYHAIYYDEVSRLNPLPPGTTPSSAVAINPDDESLRATEELRFMLFRHWNLYDAMLHSSYVAGKLGIWKERGRGRLKGLLAKMGFSILQAEQTYQHMDMDLKTQLRTKLDAIAPEYGLVELAYPSFVRCFGYRAPPLSASDAVEAIGALLDVAAGIRMEVEVAGSRGGGEWFGGGRVWETARSKPHREGKPEVETVERSNEGPETITNVQDSGEDHMRWWVLNFWEAFDSLSDVQTLHHALKLAMSVQRAIIQQGTSIIDQQEIRTLRRHRVVVITQGPYLSLFVHPGVLARLALWLVDALRDRVPGTLTGKGGKGGKKRSLPMVVACLNAEAGTYVVVGVMAAMEFGDVRKNEFGLAFLDAKDRCNAQSKHVTFEASVLEISSSDLNTFLEALCESGD